MLCHDTKDEKLCLDALHVGDSIAFEYGRLYRPFDVNSVHCLSWKDYLLLLF